jgi:beta-N-acetylhexosaminidase
MQQLMFSLYASQMPDARLLAAVRAGQVSSFCLFVDTLARPEQIYRLTETLHNAAREGGLPPPLIGTDQEGGQLIAVSEGATELPGNMALMATRDPFLAEKAGRITARELLAMGVNLNFAPVLDVLINPENPSVGVRSFGDDPVLAGRLGAAYIRGMQHEGVVATSKHFPGSGDISTDTHHALAFVEHDMERLNRVELVPFRDAISTHVGAIMTAHVIFRALDAENPVTLSPAAVRFLRETLCYEGLIITDALDMHAVAVRGAVECVADALRAGVDLALIGHLENPFHIMEEIVNLRLGNTGASRRITAARHALPTERPSLDVVGCDEHQQIAQEIADLSITVVKANGSLPLHLPADAKIAVLVQEFDRLTPADTSDRIDPAGLYRAVLKRHPNTIPVTCSGNDDHFEVDWDRLAGVAMVIVPTDTVHRRVWQASLVKALHARGCSPVVVALRSPLDILAFPEIETYLCAYSPRPVSVEAAARVLFGEIPARGVLPLALA